MVLFLACAEPEPAAPPDFDEAAHLAFRSFETGSDEELAAWVLAMEAEVDTNLDLSGDINSRYFTPTPLSLDDLVGIEVPERDPAQATTSAVARLSAFPRSKHLPLALLEDQTPLEPQCPSHYVRAFAEGDDCWPDCTLRTENDLTKESGVFVADYVLPKVYRPLVMGDGRTATLARTWTRTPVVAREEAATIEQSESLELFLDRPDGEGMLRMMAVWSETVFRDMELESWVVEGTIRSGTDAIFIRHDEWLAAQP
jgi:hypothetical protein